MCGRYSLTMPAQDLLKLLGVERINLSDPRYNIAPTQEILILRIDPEGKRQLSSVRWGLIPSWVDSIPPGAPLINARCETVASKPSFRSSFDSRRCLIPATGFYEWKKEGRKRLPYHITFSDDRLMLFAGIWDRWQNPHDPAQVVDSCTILTSDACPEVKPLHNRMPVLIPSSASDLWLTGGKDQASSFLKPYDGHDLVLSAANPLMNSGLQEGAECLQMPQPNLF